MIVCLGKRYADYMGSRRSCWLGCRRGTVRQPAGQADQVGGRTSAAVRHGHGLEWSASCTGYPSYTALRTPGPPRQRSRRDLAPAGRRALVDRRQHPASEQVEPGAEKLARRAVAVIAPDARVVDDTGFPEDEGAPHGVARQYYGSLGKGGQLPDRRLGAWGHRRRLLPAELAATCA